MVREGVDQLPRAREPQRAEPEARRDQPPALLRAISLEEVIVVGYLVTRLRQTGWGIAATVAFSSLLRGSYHLYQGFGGFLGNAIMGVVFALFFLRFRRLWPLIIAHTLLDVALPTIALDARRPSAVARIRMALHGTRVH